MEQKQAIGWIVHAPVSAHSSGPHKFDFVTFSTQLPLFGVTGDFAAERGDSWRFELFLLFGAFLASGWLWAQAMAAMAGTNFVVEF